MKSVKLMLLTVLGIFIVIVIYQNLAVLSDTQSLRLNLVVKEYETGPILLSMYFVVCFLMGLLVSYFHGLSCRFKAKNEIKHHLERISKLEEEIKVLQSLPVQGESPHFQETENASLS